MPDATDGTIGDSPGMLISSQLDPERAKPILTRGKTYPEYQVSRLSHHPETFILVAEWIPRAVRISKPYFISINLALEMGGR